jgi:hypothetical protein
MGIIAGAEGRQDLVHHRGDLAGCRLLARCGSPPGAQSQLHPSVAADRRARVRPRLAQHGSLTGAREDDRDDAKRSGDGVTIAGLSAVVASTVATISDLRTAPFLAAGIVGGLVLLARGLAGYHDAAEVSGIAPSRISALAAGEVVVTGVVEPIELTLVSALQSAPCVYYRSRVDDHGETRGIVFHEERAVGFRVRDATGAIRVFPASGRFDVPERYDERTSPLGGFPVGLQPRLGSAFGPGTDRAAQVAALLTVHPSGSVASTTPGGDRTPGPRDEPSLLARSTMSVLAGPTIAIESRDRRYTEARLEPGDIVTVLGRVVPFSEVADPAAANLLEAGLPGQDDPEVAADLAAARAAGTLEASAVDAWGNAAIEGFGIGRPVRRPALDPRAHPLPLGDAALAARAHEAFDIAPETLVLVAAPDAPLVVSLGPPAAVVARRQGTFVQGLLGAVLAIACAVGLALVLAGPG